MEIPLSPTGGIRPSGPAPAAELEGCVDNLEALVFESTAEPATVANDRSTKDRALVSLIDDPDLATWERVREECGRRGRALVPLLLTACRGADPRQRTRARTLLADQARRQGYRRLIRSALRGPKIDLESALWQLSAVHSERFSSHAYRTRLDAWGHWVQERCATREPGHRRSLALVEVLGGELGFSGQEAGYYHTDNVFLHRTIERRRGLPLTVAAVYLAVARRAGLSAAIVPLPGHVLVRLHSEKGSLLIDPFHSGAVRTKKECLTYLRQRGLSPRPEWFADASDALLFHRQILNFANCLRAPRSERVDRRRDLAWLELLSDTIARTDGRHAQADPEGA